MSNDEKIEMLQGSMSFICLMCNEHTGKMEDCEKACARREVINEACKALKNVEKYKWHDLRKNPKDLPEAGKTVFVASDIGSGRHVYGAGHITNGKWRFSAVSDYSYGVIGWMYIDPFEVN